MTVAKDNLKAKQKRVKALEKENSDKEIKIEKIVQ